MRILVISAFYFLVFLYTARALSKLSKRNEELLKVITESSEEFTKLAKKGNSADYKKGIIDAHDVLYTKYLESRGIKL